MKTKNFSLVLSLLCLVLAGTTRAYADVLGNALSFNGVNQYVSVPNFGNIIPTNEITVEFWANAGAIAQQSAFMLEPDDTGNRFSSHISYNNGNTYWDFGNINTTGRVFAANPPNTVSNWVHYALVASQSGNCMLIYTNGNLFATNSGMTPFVRGSYELRIGGNPGYMLNGRLDEFRVWNVARTQAQIQSSLGTTLAGNEANLVLYYRFDSASGTVAINSSTATGAAYNGTLVNSPAWVTSSAATTPVTTNTDSGFGSLRWAVANAVPGTTVTFAANLSGQTIVLTSGEIFLQNNRTIDASALANGIQINGNHASRMFEIGSSANVTLKSLILTNGYANRGGAILNDSHGTLALINCTLLNNTAFDDPNYDPSYFYADGGGAICNGGVNSGGGSSLVMTNCVLSGNNSPDTYGGAISTSGSTLTMVQCTLSNNDNAVDESIGGAVGDNGSSTMTFRQCLFVGNSAVMNAGGAIYVYSGLIMILTDCVLSNNWAGNIGGAIEIDGAGPIAMTNCTLSGNTASQGGAINQFYGHEMTLVGCTLSGNSALGTYGNYFGGGAIFCDSVTLIQCTLSSNSASGTVGGAISAYESPALSQCTLSGNSATYGGGIFIYNGSLSLSNCIVAANTPDNLYGKVYGTLTGTNNLTSGDPLLAPLGNYGGPTQTMPPLPGSPAIDAGGATTLTTDQRGYPRVVGPAPDIGAAEYYAYNAVVTTNADTGAGSLRYFVDHSLSPQALGARNLPGGTLIFAPALSGQTILLTNGQINLNTDLAIDASALPNGIQINGNNASRIFYVPYSAVLNSLTLTNGNSAQGGAIYTESGATLTMGNCTLAGNSAPGSQGGAIYENGSFAVTLNGCTLSDNSASAGGGAIYNSSGEFVGTLALNECTLSGNSATSGNGGAIYSGTGDSDGGALTLDQCTLAGNTAANAGAIFIDDSNGTETSLHNCIAAGNTPANISGGFTGTPNLTSGNPLLAALGNYGGPTPTMPALPGSPAIDAGTTSDFATDQRGFTRVLGSAPDLGAVEGIYNPAGPGKLTGPTRLANGTFQFGFTNYEGMTQTILATTNLTMPASQWTMLGTAGEIPAGSGHFQFTDAQATNYPQRYYRVKSP